MILTRIIEDYTKEFNLQLAAALNDDWTSQDWSYAVTEYCGRRVHSIILVKSDCLCANCGVNQVLFEGDWCDDCNLPERSKFE